MLRVIRASECIHGMSVFLTFKVNACVEEHHIP